MGEMEAGKKMKELTLLRNLRLIIRLITGAVFVYAAIWKIWDPGSFIKVIMAYEILPLFLVNPFALTMPFLEFLTGAVFLSGYFLKESGVWLVFLAFCFLTALTIVLFQGKEINCGCFGQNQPASYMNLLIDILLLSGIMFVIKKNPIPKYEL